MSQSLPRAFVWIWRGQLGSNLGTQVSLYALGLWLYQRQDQLATFASVAIAVQVAKLLVVPLLGRRLQCWPRRRVLLLAHSLATITTLALALALRQGAVPMAIVLAAIAGAAAAEATVQLCFSSLIPRLVPAAQLGRASGLFASWEGAVVMVAPFLGAALASTGGLVGVLVLDGASSLVALACTALAAWPQAALRPERRHPRAGDQASGLGVRSAIRELGQSPAWRPLLLVNTLVSAVLAAVELGFPAWVVTAMGPWRLTLAMAIGGGGYLLGTQLWWLNWARRESPQWSTVLRRCLLIQGVVLTGSGLVIFEQLTGIWFAAVGVFAGLVPVVLSALQALWQVAIPPAEQPRLFAGRYSLEWLARLLAVLLLTLLVDRVLTPAAAWPGWPEGLIAALGSGAGRPAAMALGLVGWGLLFPLLVLWRPLGRLGLGAASEA